MQPEQAGFREGSEHSQFKMDKRMRSGSDLGPREINHQIAQFEKIKELEHPNKLKANKGNSKSGFLNFLNKSSNKNYKRDSYVKSNNKRGGKVEYHNMNGFQKMIRSNQSSPHDQKKNEIQNIQDKWINAVNGSPLFPDS